MARITHIDRANTVNKLFAMVFILILLILTQITLVECAPSLTVSLGVYPTRWGLPSPLEIHGTFSEQITFDSPFQITLVSNLYNRVTSIPVVGSQDDCYAVLDNLGVVHVDRQISEERNYLYPDIQDRTFTQFYIRCHNVVLQRPVDVEHTVERVSANFFISNTRTTQTTAIPFDIVQHPTVIHHYQWKSHNQAVVAVKFSFYRPSTMSDVVEFSLDHPLLQLKRITSTHLAPGASHIEDLRRPYHLLTRDDYTGGIVCSSIEYPSSPSHIIFQRDIVSDEVIPVVSLPTATNGALLDEPYICTFTIDYPADVIHASMYSLEDMDEELKVSIRPANAPTNYAGIPLGVPPIIPYASTAIPPPGVLIWHSSHHLHENMMEFEIAIATTSLYYEGTTSNKLNIISSPQTEMTLQITLPGTNPTFLLDWEPTIRCHQHNSPDSEATLNYNGIFYLTQTSFRGLGQVCRVTLNRRPGRDLAERLHSIAINPIFRQGGNIMDISIFDAFHTFQKSINGIVLHDTSSVPTHLLPLQHTSIPLTTYQDASSGDTYIRVTMNIQYLLSYPSTLDDSNFHLHLAFNRGSDLLQALEGAMYGRTRFVVQHKSYRPSLSDSATILERSRFNFRNIFPDNSEDPEFITPPTITTAFHAGQPLRAPRLTMFHSPIVLDSTQPIRITLEWKASEDVAVGDIENIFVYPMILSNIDTLTSTFSPIYARITPVRSTPLTEYSYRCVKWDQMAAPYVYGEVEPLTVDNSFPCRSYTHGEAIDPTLWRRIVPTYPQGKIQCLYELAAVCVTPSDTEPGVYNVHPLADCPSFLGATHSIPCSFVENDPPASEWDYSIDTLQATISRSVVNAEDNYVQSKRTVTLRWVYKGDPRGTLTVAIKPLLEEHESDNEARPHGWVVLAHDIPAYLSPQPSHDGVTIGFPILNPEVEDVLVRLTLNGASYVRQITSVQHRIATDPHGVSQTGCDRDSNKVYDEVTQLCRCENGFKATGLTSVDNPLVHPLEFACASACDESKGFQWHAVIGRCVDENGNVECENYGVWNPLLQRCVCMTGYYGQYCQYGDNTDPTLVCDELQCVADHTMKGGVNGDEVISNGECAFDNDVDSDSPTVMCNCVDGFTGGQCQHQSVCGVRQCVNGRLVSPTGKPEECKCECNNDHITGSACNQCTLACRNGGVANTRCTACQCPAGYIGTTCTIPVWYHTFTLRNLPQHIVELILGTTASDKEQMVILQQTMVKYLLEDYSRVLSETFIVVDGNGNGNNVSPDDDDTRIRVRVELSQFQTVIPPANPNAPYVHIQLMLYPADMTDEMLAYAQQHGLVFDWSRITNNLDFFKQFLREQGIVDENDGSSLTPEIIDPGCTTRDCRDKIIEEESSNHALLPFPSVIAMALSISMSLVTMFTLFYA